MPVVRAFIGIKIPEKTKDKLAEIVAELKESTADLRWTHPDNLHITLKFLGDTETSTIDNLIKSLNEIVDDFPPFHLRVEGLEAMPNSRYPRVIYAGITGNKKELKKLADLVEKRLLLLGFKAEERDFLPHLTLGRVKSFKTKTVLMNKIREYHKRPIGDLLVDNIYLMKSELKPGGASHSDIACLTLKGGAKK